MIQYLPLSEDAEGGRNLYDKHLKYLKDWLAKLEKRRFDWLRRNGSDAGNVVFELMREDYDPEATALNKNIKSAKESIEALEGTRAILEKGFPGTLEQFYKGYAGTGAPKASGDGVEEAGRSRRRDCDDC
jgi:hypothetical protein